MYNLCDKSFYYTSGFIHLLHVYIIYTEQVQCYFCSLVKLNGYRCSKHLGFITSSKDSYQQNVMQKPCNCIVNISVSLSYAYLHTCPTWSIFYHTEELFVEKWGISRAEAVPLSEELWFFPRMWYSELNE